MNACARPPWTEEQKSRAAEMWRAGVSASTIGREIGATRNGVIGKMKRMGIASGAPHRGGGRPRVAKPAPAIMRSSPLPPPPAPVIVRPAERVTVETAGAGHCRFPMWGDEIGDGEVCGGACGEGPYCEAHMRVACVPQTKRARRSFAKHAEYVGRIA